MKNVSDEKWRFQDKVATYFQFICFFEAKWWRVYQLISTKKKKVYRLYPRASVVESQGFLCYVWSEFFKY